MRDLTRVRRATDDKIVAGVCEGLSRHFDIDPIVVRVIFGALTLFGGAGIVLYVLAWLTIPADDTYHSPVSGWLRRDPERILVAGLSIAAVAAFATVIGTIGVSAPNPFPAVLIGLIAIVLFALFTRRPHDGVGTTDTSTGTSAETSGGTSAETSGGTPSGTSTDDRHGDPPWWRRSANSSADSSDGAGPDRPPAPPTVPPARSRVPRSRLLSTTLAVVAIALGTIWTLDETVLGEIEPSVYPGTVLAVVAVALLIGSWYGRSRTLIVVGLLAGLATLVTTVVGPGPFGERTYRPLTATQVEPTYRLGAGQITVDLTDVGDVEALDGRTVHLDVSVGQVEVVVPTSVDATILAHVRGGEINGSRDVVDLEDGAEDLVLVPADSNAPDVTIDIDLNFGQINLMRIDCPDDSGAAMRTGLTDEVRPTLLTPTGGTRVPAACN